MHLSFTASAKIRVIVEDKTVLVPIIELVGKQAEVYDFFGKRHTIKVSPGFTDVRWLYGSASGEMLTFGDGHTVLLRKFGEAGYSRVPLNETTPPGYVRLPQKKIHQPSGIADFLDVDEKTGALFVMPDSLGAMIFVVENVGSCGVLVTREKASFRVNVDKGRPSCFVSKLLNGNFTLDLETTLNDLSHRGIVQPWKMYGEEVVEETRKSGIIFEGNNIFNDIPTAFVRRIEKPATVVFNVELDDPMCPVECQWFCT